MEKLNVKRLIILCLPIAFALSLAITLAACMAQAGRTLDESALKSTEDSAAESEATPSEQGSAYSLNLAYRAESDGTAAVVGLGSCTDADIKIPEKTPDGLRVTSIGESAFFGVKSIKSVSLPTGLREIGAYAFYGSSIESIIVTAGVKTIGECCFTACKSLKGITVDTANSEYCSIDGVLFSGDKTSLICYPSGKTDSEYTLRLGVKNILNAAFYECTYLRTVRFNGTEAEWSQIKIGANNDALLSAEVTFKKSDIK